MNFEYIPKTQKKLKFDYYIDSYEKFYCFVDEFNIVKVDWSQPISITPSYLLRLLTNGSSERARGYGKGQEKEDDEYSLKLMPYYLPLLDHGALWRLKNGNVICTATPYGDQNTIIESFIKLKQEFDYPDSIRLQFLSDEYTFRSTGNHMILIYFDPSQEAFDPHCSNAELRKRAILHSGPGVLRQQTPSSLFIRDRYVSEYAKRRAQGLCQLCGQPAPFPCPDGTPYLEVHHVIWLADGGSDSIDHTVALCPNCHRKMHILDLNDDVQKLMVLAAKTDWY